MPPQYLDRERIADLLPMEEAISVMERTFHSLAAGECLQPLRSLMWLPDRTGILGMIPGYAKGPDSSHLAILGTGEQAERHIRAISLVRPIEKISIWGRNSAHAETLARKFKNAQIAPTAKEAINDADIICTVTASREPILYGEWLPEGVHINAVGSCTPSTRELDTAAVLRSRIFTDRYESLFHEAGEFLIPKKEGLLTETDTQAELGELLVGTKEGRRNAADITLFKSLGIAAEDLFAAHYIFEKLQ